jgi:hypothetical protein
MPPPDDHEPFTRRVLTGFSRLLEGLADPDSPSPLDPPSPITIETRERILRQYLANPEGRRALSGLGPPLRRNIDYSAVARRTFLVDQLPDGALPTYDRDPDVAAVAPEPIPAWCVEGVWARQPSTGFIGQVYEVHNRSVTFSTWRRPEHLTIMPRESMAEFEPLVGEPPPPRTAYERLMDDDYFI